LIFSALAVFCSLSAQADQQDPPACRQGQEKVLKQDFKILKPNVGTIYKGMPRQDLLLAGFNKETMLDYYTYDDMEFMIFSDPTTVSFEDIITFIVKGGEVVDWFKGYRDDVLEAGM
jgi:hypothetical protein